MWRFIKNIFTNTISILIAFFILFFIFIGVSGAIVSGLKNTEKPTIEPNSVLQIHLDTPIKEHYSDEKNPLNELFDNYTPMSLHQITTAIKNAATDPNISQISIETSTILASYTQIKSIRDALQKFKESGKKIRAYAHFYDQKKYYLSSVADTIYLAPEGGVTLEGLATEIYYYKDFQEKYGVKMEVIRHGNYKSAVEPFLRSDISKENKEQLTAMLQSMWGYFSKDIATSRKVNLREVNRWADTGENYFANTALKNNAIDSIAYKNNYDRFYFFNDKISLADYIKAGKGKKKVSFKIKNKIAVLHASGEIVDGQGNENQIGEEDFIKLLDKIRDNSRIKAVVMRINSPGGSARASDLIWNAIEQLKKRKPIVVSMGTYAASGGYYIACNADYIIAEPTTVTGSIGVFSILPNLQGAADKIGIHSSRIQTNKSPFYSLTKKINPSFKRFMQKNIQRIYNTFLTKVGKGRGMTSNEVDKIAQGRVWTGAQAKKNGLVDAMGNLDKAIKKAADLAGITAPYKIKHYPNENKKYDALLKQLSQIWTPSFLKKIPNEMIENVRFLETIIKEKQPVIKAQLPFFMNLN